MGAERRILDVSCAFSSLVPPQLLTKVPFGGLRTVFRSSAMLMLLGVMVVRSTISE
jgi:hypothetical protein